jgi:hypothetical protein
MTAPVTCAPTGRIGFPRDGCLRAQNRILRHFTLPGQFRTDEPREPRARAAAEPPRYAAEALPAECSDGRVADTTEQKSS